MVSIADTRKKLERICRYIARPTVAVLVPKPLFKLTRYYGVFAPNSTHRAAITPSLQTRKHRYKIAEEESCIAEKHLDRAFAVEPPNRVWSGDVTSI